MINITRYDINDAGELPLSTGRYVRWEDVEDLLVEHAREIDRLEREMESKDMSYSYGYDDGYSDAKGDCNCGS